MACNTEHCSTTNDVCLDHLVPQDLALAYRKAKVDLFYSNDDRSADLLEYEEKLGDHCNTLHRELISYFDSQDLSNPFFLQEGFLGDFVLMPKKFSHTSECGSGTNPTCPAPSDSTNGFLSFDAKPLSDTEGCQADFRILSRCSIDLHVLSSLWIGTVGEKLDRALGLPQKSADLDETNTDKISSAYGNRLRRRKDFSYNWHSPGSFKPYAQQYVAWQTEAFRSIEGSLKRKEKVMAITADATNFFPSIQVEFLDKFIDEKFLASFTDTNESLMLTEREQKFTKLLVSILRSWRRQTSLEVNKSPEDTDANIRVGLPIGLSASGVIANLAISKFDQIIREQVNPLFYGRYVDDIVMVLNKTDAMNSRDAVWDWIITRFNAQDRGQLVASSENGFSIFHPIGSLFTETEMTVSVASTIVFSGGKNNCFSLSGDHGKALLRSLQSSILERASEWRALPDIPKESKDVSSTILDALGSGGEVTHHLGGVTQLTTSKAAFALRLRDYEALCQDLDPDSWKDHRAEFFKAIDHSVYTLSNFFTLERYFPRLLALAVMCGDWKAFTAQVQKLYKLYQMIAAPSDGEVTYSLSLNGEHENVPQHLISLWRDRFETVLISTVKKSAKESLPDSTITELQKLVDPDQGMSHTTFVELNTHSRQEWERYFLADLAATPLRSIYIDHLHPEVTNFPHTCVDHRFARLLPEEHAENQIKALKQISHNLQLAPRQDPLQAPTDNDNGIEESAGKSTGFIFATRPPNISEICVMTRALSPKKKKRPSRVSLLKPISDLMLAFRGYNINLEDFSEDAEKQYQLVTIPSTKKGKGDADELYPKEKLSIALGTVHTSRNQLSDSLHDAPDRTLERYSNFCTLINRVINGPERAQLLVLPELSVPITWYSRFAYKLQVRNTSFVAGVEYRQSKRNKHKVHNQVWASFVTRAWGFRTSLTYIQDKIRPAHGEETNLLQERQLTLKPDIGWDDPPIIEHEGVRYGLLLCSELTNIEYRAYFRGKIDVLIVPQWNQDLKTFNSLVESAALDIHAYIVQVNNREYGDTRIRGPYKEEHERDIVKVSGGLHDYVVVGSVQVRELRKFQRKHYDPEGKYKPLPDGFKLDTSRKLKKSES